MRRLGHQVSLGVGAILPGPHAPSDVAAEQRAAGGPGALARDKGQLRGALGQLVQVGDGPDEGGEPGGGRGQAGGGGEVVLADEPQGQCAQLGQRGVGVLEGLAAGPELTEACLGAGARDVGGLAVEEEGVGAGRVGGAAGGGGQGAQVGLREGDGEGRVGREVELGVTLAPVPE